MSLGAAFNEDTWRVRLTLADFPNGSVRVERSINGLLWLPVRGGMPLPIIGGVAVLDDWEYTEGVENTYRVTQASLEDTMEVWTSSGTWTKADYPGLVALWVRAQAPGGAGGGAATTDGTSRSGGEGGSGGEYIEAIIPASALGDTETITINAAGTGSAGASGGSGGTVSFGSHIVANGGAGGTVSTGTGATGVTGSLGGSGGTVPAGGISIPGGRSGGVHRNSTANQVIAGSGGDSMLGRGAPAHIPGTSGFNGVNGTGFGSGGSGASNLVSQGTTRAGGDGAPGVIITVPIYAG